ncbi:unnamed protein product, partial [Mesorhabditis spiculigera]
MSVDGGGFSGVVRISNVSDFIAPSKSCIIPLNENTQTVAVEEPLVSIGRRKREKETEPHDVKKKAIKVTLNDCLACSGCITSAETVLIDAQSLASLLSGIEKSTLAVITVSPQSVCSIASHRGLSTAEAARRIASYFFSKGVRFVLDSSIGRIFALERECEEVENRLGNGPAILSSICPGFVCYAEKSQGDLLVPLLSQARSPQAVMGALVKNYLSRRNNTAPSDIFHATVMPCFDKKLEASRNDFLLEGNVHEVDCVVSTGELDSVLDEVDKLYESVEPGWLGDFGRGNLLGGQGGTSGGYASAVVSSLMERNPNLQAESSQPQKNLEVTRLTEDGKKPLVIAKVYGFKNIQNMVRKLKTRKCEYDYVEVMACPGGCGNGGGQVRQETDAEREAARIRVEEMYGSLKADGCATELRQSIATDWGSMDERWRERLNTEFRPIVAKSLNMDY